jgi:dihydrofolate synthase/folylpolyglutamate synthase
MSWSAEEAERYLAGLEPVGWNFGLERIRRLVSALGMPQHRFASIHVVGTNGKSSVTAMTAALLEAHGLRAGAYLSPHLARWSERVEVGGREIEPEAFAAAVERTAQGVEAVNRALEEGEAVTQFEAVTAAAFVALASARVDFGVIEAGLGGRLDATNVIPSRVAVLTSVGLDHTQWLGESVEEIAAEKLAVLRDESVLVVGDVPPPVAALAERTAVEHGAEIRRAGNAASRSLAVPGEYQRRNFAVACAAAEAAIGPLDAARVEQVAAGLRLPGRLELLSGDPPLVLDAAHNPQAAAALAEALPEVAEGRPVVACLAVLADKDAGGIAAALAPALDAAVATEIEPGRLTGVGRPGSSFLEAESLADALRDAGVPLVESVAEPRAALRRALELAAERSGVALVAGSHYLLRDAGRAPAGSDRRPGRTSGS